MTDESWLEVHSTACRRACSSCAMAAREQLPRRQRAVRTCAAHTRSPAQAGTRQQARMAPSRGRALRPPFQMLTPAFTPLPTPICMMV